MYAGTERKSKEASNSMGGGEGTPSEKMHGVDANAGANRGGRGKVFIESRNLFNSAPR